MSRIRMGFILLVAAAPLGWSAAVAENLPGGCYTESDHVRCLGRAFKEDRSVTRPVVPPRPNFPPAEERSLDFTGKKRFSADTDSLRPEQRPQRAQSTAEGRSRRYRPLPNLDGGRYIPGTRVGPSSPLFGRRR